jgi:3',5'-cyclic AMP phosphodiesterase CpdA
MALLFKKLLVFTDLHIIEAGQDIIGLDPAMRFAEGLAHALAHHPDASGLVLMGDLTHHGRPAQYERLIDILAPVKIPITYLLGNHDDRAMFRKLFPEASVTSSGHVQRMQDFGELVLITLDTTDPDVDPPHSGIFCHDRLAWLEHSLAKARGKPVIVAMHHPPVMTGFTGMDRIALQNPAPLRALLRAYDGPLHLLCGHVHRTISGLAHGLPFTIFKSPCHQQPMTLGVGGTDQSVDEAGAYGIVLAGPEGIVVHSEDFASAATATPKRDPGSH